MSRPDPDTELAMLVRDAAPRPSAEFLEGLDARVGERFGRPARERRAWLSWPRLVPALGACAVLIAVVAIAVGQSGGGSDENAKPFTPQAGHTPLDDGGSAAATAAPKGAATESAAPAPARQARGGSTTAATPSAVAVPSTPHRRVIRDTQLALLSPLREFAATTDGVIATADRFDGIVQRSDVNQTGSSAHASFDLRIPAGRLDDAMAALSRLAHVTSRSASSQDVTADYLSANERLAEARAERRAILRALAKADTAAETAALRIRLREVDARLSRARGDVASLKRRTDYVRVAVTVDGARRGETIPGPKADDRWTPGDALRDAGRILQTTAGIALIALAIGLPLGLLCGLGIAGGRVVRRRRREAALG